MEACGSLTCLWMWGHNVQAEDMAQSQGLPIKAWNEHGAEIVHVEWNNLQKDTFVTASWDQTVKVVSLSPGAEVPTEPPVQRRSCDFALVYTSASLSDILCRMVASHTINASYLCCRWHAQDIRYP